MQKTVRALAIICFILCISGMSDAAADYDHTIDLGKISFAWAVEGDVMNVRLAAKTTGWVGIGFNPSKKMQDANFIIGYVKKGKVKIADHFGTTTLKHKADTRIGGNNDLTNIAGTEEKGVTEIAFTIPLDSGDAKDSAIGADGETVVLLAYGAGRDSFLSKHAFKAVLKVELATGTFSRVK